MRLMIVEDDYITLEGIVKMVKWDALGIHSLEKTDDGLRAVELAARFHPDIVLSDIRMPRLDGIGFAKRLREICPECKIIFMSAYVDIAYCKEAIKLSAVRVIEKPIDLNELCAALTDAVELRTREQTRLRSSRQAHQALRLSLPLLRSELSALLVSEDSDPDRVAQMLQLLPVELPDAPIFTVALLTMREDAAASADAFDARWRPRLEALLVQHGYGGFAAMSDECTVVVHLCVGSAEAERPQECDRLCAAVLDVLPDCASIAVGEPAPGVEGIPRSYGTALAARQRQFVTGQRIGVYAAPGGGQEYDFDPRFVEEFALMLRQRDENGLRRMRLRLAEAIAQHPDTYAGRIRVFYFRLAMCILQAARAEDLPPLDERLNGEDRLWEAISRLSSLGDLEALLNDLTVEYLRLAAEKYRHGATVREILAYIHAHYREPSLSTADIGRHIFLSPAYICALFKQETGETIGHYINRCRIERSREFLLDPDIKIADIAREIGYRDGDYFARVFRKLEGVAPSEYRETAALR